MIDASEKAIKTFDARYTKEQQDRGQWIKDHAAVLFDSIDNIEIPSGNTESGRLINLAKTDLESCVMWAIKALSRL